MCVYVYVCVRVCVYIYVCICVCMCVDYTVNNTPYNNEGIKPMFIFGCLSQNAIFAKILINKYSKIIPLHILGHQKASFKFLNLKRRNVMRKRYRLRIGSFGVAWALHIIQCMRTMNSIRRTLYIVHRTLYAVHSTPYTVHCR